MCVMTMLCLNQLCCSSEIVSLILLLCFAGVTVAAVAGACAMSIVF
jgi:hypothetical protein